MKEIKLEILFEIHNKDFTKSISKHYTTVDRLIDGRDKFDYKSVDIIAKRQYTGLKDCEGVEIYEGDIVKCYWLAELGVTEIDCFHTGVVRFVDCRFEVSFSDKAYIRNVGENGVYSVTKLELTCYSHDEDCYLEYKVIGNIHENPELLESEK